MKESSVLFPLQTDCAARFASDSAAVERAAYVVVGMFTPSHEGLATRLAESCTRHSLAFSLFSVPRIHRSISPRGSLEAFEYTKPNFIASRLLHFRKPVLYIDVDCVVRLPPVLAPLLEAQVDFAIYNWLADRFNDAYLPATVQVGTPPNVVVHTDRYLRFSHRLPYFAPNQLSCSGAVQFYRPSQSALELLRRWHLNVIRLENLADDCCLDFTFNNGGSEIPGLRCGWLPKSHCRYGWWFYVEPVIDHPDIPAQPVNVPIHDELGRLRWYEDRAERVDPAPIFPEDALVDTVERYLATIENGVLKNVAYLPENLHIYR